MVHLYSGERRRGDFEDCVYKLVGQEFPLQVYSIDMSRQRRWDISQPYVYDLMICLLYTSPSPRDLH